MLHDEGLLYFMVRVGRYVCYAYPCHWAGSLMKIYCNEDFLGLDVFMVDMMPLFTSQPQIYGSPKAFTLKKCGVYSSLGAGMQKLRRANGAPCPIIARY